MKFKGTPGPWSAHDDEESMATSVVMNDFGDILCVVGTYMTSAEEDYANANLIAAAPDLLEALQEMTAIVKKNSYPQPDKPGSNYARAEWAESIISKALGEE
ncbi:hypothetical protein QMS95_04390 [Cronobacter sakazakii]|nr:hypothetical protein [Cronobacter malonaticus]KAB0812438.1 hypothetical protein FZI15_00180 [Cronobacter sakazakii]MDK1224668.1 hypothetical protein [Cronobacter turicensis]KAB0819849.1 hypothetical protein FZI44_18670 [Cronobacter sakazakii]MDI7514735.1 hypothetical protein [Cronobacter sakazakii]